MADPIVFTTDLRINGVLIAKGIALQTACITDAMIAALAAISASKVQQQKTVTYRQATGTAIVAATEDVHIVHGASGVVYAVEVMAATQPTGDHAVTVDVQVSTGGGSFASVLTGVITLNSGVASKAVVDGALVGSPALVDGDIVRVVVAVSGTTSSQGQGLVVSITVKETPD